MDTGIADLSRITPLIARPDGPDSHFAINTSTRCQHRCVYCFEGERSGLRDIPADGVRALLRKAAESVEHVVFMGAEATLRSDFAELVAYGTRLGLEMRVSTNGLRFADRRFLDATLDAGLKAVELSFPYPDEAVYQAISGAKPAGFRMLLAALDNLRSVQDRVACNVNVVVSAFNHSRLAEAVALAAVHLGRAMTVLTLKRCATDEFRMGVSADDLRAALVPLLAGWPHPFPAIHRGFPLCVVPGFEHLDADLVYIRDGVRVMDNFQVQDRFIPMYDPVIEATRHPPVGCAGCTLDAVCLRRELFAERPGDPDTMPRPSKRDPGEVLVANGATPDGVEATLARLRALHGAARDASPEDCDALAARMGVSPLAARVDRLRRAPDGRGFLFDLVPPGGGARARICLDRIEEPGPDPGALLDLTVADGPAQGRLQGFFDTVSGWSPHGESIPDPAALRSRLVAAEANAPIEAFRTLAVAGDFVAGWQPATGMACTVRVLPATATEARGALFCGRFLLAPAPADTPAEARAWLARIGNALHDDAAGDEDAAWLDALWQAFGPRLWPGAKRGAVLRTVDVTPTPPEVRAVEATFDLGNAAMARVTLRPASAAGAAFVRTPRVAMAYRVDGIATNDPLVTALLHALAKRLPR